MEKETSKTDFQELQNPIYWFGNYSRLKYSAEVLKKEMRQVRVNSGVTRAQQSQNVLGLFESYMMLLGFAVENLVKGCAIQAYLKKEPNYLFKNLTDIKQKAWAGDSGHNTRKILRQSGFEATKVESNLLERLETFCTWGSRYPIPRNEEELNSVMKGNKRSLLGSDREVLRVLEFRLRQQFDIQPLFIAPDNLG